MLENGSDICNCKKVKCIRHGNCRQCLEYHEKSKRLPYCKRPTKKILGKLLGK